MTRFTTGMSMATPRKTSRAAFQETHTNNGVRAVIEVQCAVCGAKFLGHKCKKQLYCSRRCYFLAPKKRNSRECRHCGGSFETPPTSNKRFCSSECRSLGHKPGKHRMSATRLHTIWCQMKTRCKCPTSVAFKYYGGRGISVCKEWDESFMAFYDWAIANGYSEDLEIDRRNNNGNYEPSNCRWATRQQQMCNTRKRADAKTSKFRGVSKHSQNGSWITQICHNRKTMYVGSFETEIDAAKAYDQAARSRFGDFASLNFPEVQQDARA